MFKQLEISVYATMTTLLLSSCSPDNARESTVASSSTQHTDHIAQEILQTASQSDILSARQEAKLEVSASDILALSMLPEHASTPFDAASEPSDLPPLHPICEQYYRRVDTCFAHQGNDANALRTKNQEDKLAMRREQPSEATCIALNQSFDDVATNLACR